VISGRADRGATRTATAAAPPYESAEAKAEIQTALKAGRASNLPVLIVFGANWCADCKLLDTAFKTGESAALNVVSSRR